MSRRRARATDTSEERYVPRWPLVAGALALLLVVVLAGYTAGLAVADGRTEAEPEQETATVSGVLAQPPGAPEEEASEMPGEEEEAVHPAGLDPEVVYVLQNLNGDRVLDVVQASTANGAPVHLWERHDQANQQWRFVPVDDDHYEIEGVGSGKLLEIPSDPGAGPGATLLTRTGGANQQWAVVEVGQGVIRLVNRATGQVLESQNGSPDNGALAAQAPDGGQPHQKWRLVPLG